MVRKTDNLFNWWYYLIRRNSVHDKVSNPNHNSSYTDYFATIATADEANQATMLNPHVEGTYDPSTNTTALSRKSR
jgi:hypothetical protein